jgi:hypothetical protein
MSRKPKPRRPLQNETDGMIVTIDDVVVWDGEGDQLGAPSLVGTKLPARPARRKPAIDPTLAPGNPRPFVADVDGIEMSKGPVRLKSGTLPPSRKPAK